MNFESTAVIVALSINVIVFLTFILGGMKWITKVNSSLERIMERETTTVQALEKLTRWQADMDKRHSYEDGLNELSNRKKRKTKS